MWPRKDSKYSIENFPISNILFKILPILFGLTALILLFFKLQAAVVIFEHLPCTKCIMKSSYLPILGAGYFVAFLTTILCFPTFPHPYLRRIGFLFAIGFAIALTYLGPYLCTLCLIAHGCHIFMWIFWHPRQKRPEKLVGVKMLLVCISALTIMALFVTLNLAF